MIVFTRKIARLSLLTGATFFFLLAGLALKIPLPESSGRRTLRKAHATMHWARTICRILGIRVSPAGAIRHIPNTLTVSNHVSYTDILVLGSLRPSLFVSKDDVKRWPVLGWLARMSGTVFIDRESGRSAWEALDEVQKRIESGPTVIVFPEGTTSSGAEVREFKGFFFALPARMRIPVQPLSIRYRAWERNEGVCPVAWFGDMTLLPHVWRLLGIRRIDAHVYYNPAITEVAPEASPSEARRRLCAAAAESVREGLTRLSSHHMTPDEKTRLSHPHDTIGR